MFHSQEGVGHCGNTMGGKTWNHQKRGRKENEAAERHKRDSEKAKTIFNKENVYPSKINICNTLCAYYIKDMSCSSKYFFSK